MNWKILPAAASQNSTAPVSRFTSPSNKPKTFTFADQDGPKLPFCHPSGFKKKTWQNWKIWSSWRCYIPYWKWGIFSIAMVVYRRGEGLLTTRFEQQNQQNPDMTFHEILTESWRDPYLSILLSLCNWLVSHPLHTANNQGFGHCSHPTSSSRASRGRKFQKKKELYSKERICL